MVLLVDLALLFVGCSSSQQTAVPETTAQRSTNAVSTDPQLNAILEQSCYQCHSTGGAAPWYASVSPTYLAANLARGVLNFSDWQTYDAQKKADALNSIEQAVSSRFDAPWRLHGARSLCAPGRRTRSRRCSSGHRSPHWLHTDSHYGINRCSQKTMNLQKTCRSS
jgi:hypothetical protein